jgi:predicted SnoaL-like aldol condensation-catalyzing enzyme
MGAKSRRSQRAAIGFLKAVTSGQDPHAAAARVFAPRARHHNPHVPAGMPALLDAIAADYRKHPRTALEVVNVAADDTRVAVHSRVRHKPKDRGFAVLHLFRFARGKAVELWDIGMEVPAKSPNRDGTF